MAVNHLQQGTNVFKVRAKDQFNNWGAISSKTILVDSIPPGANAITSLGAVSGAKYYCWMSTGKKNDIGNNTSHESLTVSDMSFDWSATGGASGNHVQMWSSGAENPPIQWIHDGRSSNKTSIGAIHIWTLDRNHEKDSNSMTSTSRSDSSGLAGNSAKVSYSSDATNWTSYVTSGGGLPGSTAITGPSAVDGNVFSKISIATQNSAFPEGNSYWRVQCEDQAGNVGSTIDAFSATPATHPEYFIIRKDTEATLPDALISINGNNYSPTLFFKPDVIDGFTATWTVEHTTSDGVSGFGNMYADISNDGEAHNVYQFVMDGQPMGYKYLRSSDTAQETTGSVTTTFTVDTDGGMADGFQFDYTDIFAGGSQNALQEANGTGSNTGIITFHIGYTDYATNQATQRNYNLNWDPSPPTLSPAGATSQDGTAWYNATTVAKPSISCYDSNSGIKATKIFYALVNESDVLYQDGSTTVQSAGGTEYNLPTILAYDQDTLNGLDTTGWNRAYVSTAVDGGGSQATSSSVGQWSQLYACPGNTTGDTTTPTASAIPPVFSTSGTDPNQVKIIWVVQDHAGWNTIQTSKFGIDTTSPVIPSLLVEKNSGSGSMGVNWMNDASPYITATTTDDQSNFTGKWSGCMFTPEEVLLNTHVAKKPDDGLELTTDTTPTLDVATDLALEGDSQNLYTATRQDV